MAPEHTPASEEAVAVVLSSLVFGISLCTFIQCLRWLLFTEHGWKLRNRINWAFVIVTLVIMALTSLWLGLRTRNLMDQVLFISESLPGTLYDMPGWMNVLRCAVSAFAALSADIVLIYRCWVVYEYSLGVVVLPIILWLGGIACAAIQIYLQTTNIHDINTGPKNWGSVNMSVGPGIVLIPFWGLTVALNAYTTFMLLHRLYHFVRRSGPYSQQLLSIMRILAESGVLYLSMTLARFVSWFFKNSLAIVVIGALDTPIIGIAFHLVIIRAAQNRVVGMEPSSGVISELQFDSGVSSADHLPTSAEESFK